MKRELQVIPYFHGVQPGWFLMLTHQADRICKKAAKISRRDPLNRLSHFPGTIELEYHLLVTEIQKFLWNV